MQQRIKQATLKSPPLGQESPVNVGPHTTNAGGGALEVGWKTHSDLPNWERQNLRTNPLPMASRRLMTSSGKNKIIIHETKKLKSLKAQAKLKRQEAEEGDADLDLPKRRATGNTARPGTSLPPLKERQRLVQLERSIKQLMPELEEESVLVQRRNDDAGTSSQYVTCITGVSALNIL